jgi:hypothetical protein
MVTAERLIMSDNFAEQLPIFPFAARSACSPFGADLLMAGTSADTVRGPRPADLAENSNAVGKVTLRKTACATSNRA